MATVPILGTGLAVTNVEALSALINYTNYTNGGSAITEYWVQSVAGSSSPDPGNYTQGIIQTSPTAWPVIGALEPNTKYYTRVRLKNAIGYSTPTDWVYYTTLVAAYVKVSGSWRRATCYVKVNGVWRVATPYKKVLGVWRV